MKLPDGRCYALPSRGALCPSATLPRRPPLPRLLPSVRYRSQLAGDAVATRDTSASLRLPRPAPPAYGLQRPLSFLVLRALSPHRSVGLVVAAAPFRRHYGLCLYRLPPLLFVLKAPPLAVLRSPRRARWARLAPVRGWSRGSAPTGALRPVSHSCQSPRPLVAGTGIPRPVGAEW